MVIPSSRFSKTVATGRRVPRKTHAPLTFPGTLSTAGHCDQSSAIAVSPFLLSQPESLGSTRTGVNTPEFPIWGRWRGLDPWTPPPVQLSPFRTQTTRQPTSKGLRPKSLRPLAAPYRVENHV